MNYLIPANSKKGQLIFNVFRWIDLIIALIGAMLTLLLMFAIPGDRLLLLVIKLLPLGIALLLVLPIPYYHNVLVFLEELVQFYMNTRVYKWKGWCVRHGFSEEQ